MNKTSETLLRRTQRLHRLSGFTLIEVLVVVVILGILAAIVVPNIMQEPDKAKIVAAKSTIRNIQSALERYRLDNHDYPKTDQGLGVLVNEYMPRIPKDPWGNDYLYLSPGSHGDIDIYSLGRDGLPGGEGPDADIGNWNL